MAFASDYPVKHPFGATYKPWSPSKPHTGEDRPMPTGTPVNVGNTIIGLAGATGQANGPHVHIQKYKSIYHDPAGRGLAGTIAFPATVTETGYKADTGNYVRIVDNEGVRWSYFHLLKIMVNKGQRINGGEDMAEPEFIDLAWQGFFDARAKPEDIAYFKGRPYPELIAHGAKYNEKWRKELTAKGKAYDSVLERAVKAEAGQAHLDKALKDAYEEIERLKNSEGFEPVKEQLYKEKEK